MDYPDYFARFYDIIYDHMRSDVDLDYYLKKISASKGRVLEIGVGTGRLFTAAIRANADIYGIDVSQSMLDILLSKLDPEHHHRISLQDAVDFHFPWKFDLIIAPFRVYSHIISVADQLKALNNAAEHLGKQGRLIFDLYVPDSGMIAAGLSNVKDFEGEYAPGRTFSRTVSMTADIVHQISDITMTMRWMELDKERVEDFSFRFRFYFRYEVEHLVARSALTLEHLYGDFNENDITTGSREMVVVCRK
jgi:SAM-dependent methyltransferase